MKKHLLTAAAVIGFCLGNAGLTHAAGDPVEGAKKTSMCAGCHGVPGYRTVYPDIYQVPKLGGQHPEYIVKALQEYKSGERTYPTMRAIAASLSDQDMENLAAYYSAK